MITQDIIDGYNNEQKLAYVSAKVLKNIEKNIYFEITVTVTYINDLNNDKDWNEVLSHFPPLARDYSFSNESVLNKGFVEYNEIKDEFKNKGLVAAFNLMNQKRKQIDSQTIYKTLDDYAHSNYEYSLANYGDLFKLIIDKQFATLTPEYLSTSEKFWWMMMMNCKMIISKYALLDDDQRSEFYESFISGKSDVREENFDAIETIKSGVVIFSDKILKTVLGLVYTCLRNPAIFQIITSEFKKRYEIVCERIRMIFFTPNFEENPDKTYFGNYNIKRAKELYVTFSEKIIPFLEANFENEVAFISVFEGLFMNIFPNIPYMDYVIKIIAFIFCKSCSDWKKEIISLKRIFGGISKIIEMLDIKNCIYEQNFNLMPYSFIGLNGNVFQFYDKKRYKRCIKIPLITNTIVKINDRLKKYFDNIQIKFIETNIEKDYNNILTNITNESIKDTYFQNLYIYLGFKTNTIGKYYYYIRGEVKGKTWYNWLTNIDVDITNENIEKYLKEEKKHLIQLIKRDYNSYKTQLYEYDYIKIKYDNSEWPAVAKITFIDLDNKYCYLELDPKSENTNTNAIYTQLGTTISKDDSIYKYISTTIYDAISPSKILSNVKFLLSDLEVIKPNIYPRLNKNIPPSIFINSYGLQKMYKWKKLCVDTYCSDLDISYFYKNNGRMDNGVISDENGLYKLYDVTINNIYINYFNGQQIKSKNTFFYNEGDLLVDDSYFEEGDNRNFVYDKVLAQNEYAFYYSNFACLRKPICKGFLNPKEYMTYEKYIYNWKVWINYFINNENNDYNTTKKIIQKDINNFEEFEFKLQMLTSMINCIPQIKTKKKWENDSEYKNHDLLINTYINSDDINTKKYTLRNISKLARFCNSKDINYFVTKFPDGATIAPIEKGLNTFLIFEPQTIFKLINKLWPLVDKIYNAEYEIGDTKIKFNPNLHIFNFFYNSILRETIEKNIIEEEYDNKLQQELGIYYKYISYFENENSILNNDDVFKKFPEKKILKLNNKFEEKILNIMNNINDYYYLELINYSASDLNKIYKDIAIARSDIISSFENLSDKSEIKNYKLTEDNIKQIKKHFNTLFYSDISKKAFDFDSNNRDEYIYSIFNTMFNTKDLKEIVTEYLFNTDLFKRSAYSKYAFFGDYTTLNNNYPELKYITYNKLQDKFLIKSLCFNPFTKEENFGYIDIDFYNAIRINKEKINNFMIKFTDANNKVKLKHDHDGKKEKRIYYIFKDIKDKYTFSNITSDIKLFSDILASITVTYNFTNANNNKQSIILLANYIDDYSSEKTDIINHKISTRGSSIYYENSIIKETREIYKDNKKIKNFNYDFNNIYLRSQFYDIVEKSYTKYNEIVETYKKINKSHLKYEKNNASIDLKTYISIMPENKKEYLDLYYEDNYWNNTSFTWNINTIMFYEGVSDEDEDDDDKFIKKMRDEFDTREYNKQNQIQILNNGIKKSPNGSVVLDLKARFDEKGTYIFSKNNAEKITRTLKNYIFDIERTIDTKSNISYYSEKYSISFYDILAKGREQFDTIYDNALKPIENAKKGLYNMLDKAKQGINNINGNTVKGGDGGDNTDIVSNIKVFAKNRDYSNLILRLKDREGDFPNIHAFRGSDVFSIISYFDYCKLQTDFNNDDDSQILEKYINKIKNIKKEILKELSSYLNYLKENKQTIHDKTTSNVLTSIFYDKTGYLKNFYNMIEYCDVLLDIQKLHAKFSVNRVHNTIADFNEKYKIDIVKIYEYTKKTIEDINNLIVNSNFTIEESYKDYTETINALRINGDIIDSNGISNLKIFMTIFDETYNNINNKQILQTFGHSKTAIPLIQNLLKKKENSFDNYLMKNSTNTDVGKKANYFEDYELVVINLPYNFSGTSEQCQQWHQTLKYEGYDIEYEESEISSEEADKNDKVASNFALVSSVGIVLGVAALGTYAASGAVASAAATVGTGAATAVGSVAGATAGAAASTVASDAVVNKASQYSSKLIATGALVGLAATAVLQDVIYDLNKVHWKLKGEIGENPNDLRYLHWARMEDNDIWRYSTNRNEQKYIPSSVENYERFVIELARDGSDLEPDMIKFPDMEEPLFVYVDKRYRSKAFCSAALYNHTDEIISKANVLYNKLLMDVENEKMNGLLKIKYYPNDKNCEYTSKIIGNVKIINNSEFTYSDTIGYFNEKYNKNLNDKFTEINKQYGTEYTNNSKTKCHLKSKDMIYIDNLSKFMARGDTSYLFDEKFQAKYNNIEKQKKLSDIFEAIYTLLTDEEITKFVDNKKPEWNTFADIEKWYETNKGKVEPKKLENVKLKKEADENAILDLELKKKADEKAILDAKLKKEADEKEKEKEIEKKMQGVFNDTKFKDEIFKENYNNLPNDKKKFIYKLLLNDTSENYKNEFYGTTYSNFKQRFDELNKQIEINIVNKTDLYKVKRVTVIKDYYSKKFNNENYIPTIFDIVHIIVNGIQFKKENIDKNINKMTNIDSDLKPKIIEYLTGDNTTTGGSNKKNMRSKRRYYINNSNKYTRRKLYK